MSAKPKRSETTSPYSDNIVVSHRSALCHYITILS